MRDKKIQTKDSVWYRTTVNEMHREKKKWNNNGYTQQQNDWTRNVWRFYLFDGWNLISAI